jgi:hypothetical protein
MTRTSLYATLLCALTGCSGGSQTAALPAQVAAPITAAAPTAQASPTATPSVQATPTLVSGPNHISASLGAIVSLGATRKPQTAILSNQIPVVVMGYNPVMPSFGATVYTWAENSVNAPIVESSVTASAPNATIASVQDNQNAFSLTQHDWQLTLKPTATGKSSIAVNFPDASGAIPLRVYDSWQLSCTGFNSPAFPGEWTYVGGALKGQQFPQEDAVVDCVHQVLQFPQGGAFLKNATADAWGSLLTQFASALTVGPIVTPLGSAPFSGLNVGDIYVVKLSDGGYAKFMVTTASGPANGLTIQGIASHDSPSGSGIFPY